MLRSLAAGIAYHCIPYIQLIRLIFLLPDPLLPFAQNQLYSQNIFDFMEPYAVPQENGNRTDVRWMFLSNKNSEGLLVIADSLLSMSAWPYTEENIEDSKHTIDLKDAGYITLNIDLSQMGVGGNDSWSEVAAPLPKYQIPAGSYRYGFYLIPYKKGKQRLSDFVKKSTEGNH